MTDTALSRAAAFCQSYGLTRPILLAPMAGACPPALSVAVAQAGGMGACGCLMMPPDQIAAWADQVRAATTGPFQLNLWIPDPAPARDPRHEAQLRAFLSRWGPKVPADAADMPGQDFDAQSAALLATRPAVISSIMGVYPAPFVAAMKAQGIAWFATVTSVTEAIAAQAAGADVIVAQGVEAGGHRGAFDATDTSGAMIGLMALLPAVVDAVDLPVVATGGIADGRGIAAALTLGASAVQIGTGFLRTAEAALHPAWADGIAAARPEDTTPTRAFSGRLGRALRTAYTTAAQTGPRPAPYPIQRNLTQAMRAQATTLDTMQAWAGQSAGLARATSAATLTLDLWAEAVPLLPP